MDEMNGEDNKLQTKPWLCSHALEVDDNATVAPNGFL